MLAYILTQFNVTRIGALALIILALTGCGPREKDMPREVRTREQIEAALLAEKQKMVDEEENRKAAVSTNQARARQNSQYFAKAYLAADNTYRGWSVIPATDSSISMRCPSGDGFATIELVFRNTDGKRVSETIKCSTYEENIGCMSLERFQSSKYSQKDGSCDKQLPSTLPAITATLGN